MTSSGNGRCDDTCADSSASLAQCCSCGGFFLSFAIFALLWGLLVFLGILALFLGYTFGVTLFAPPVFSPLLSLLRWLDSCFSYWPPSLFVRM